MARKVSTIPGLAAWSASSQLMAASVLLLGTFTLSVQDMVMKIISGDISLWQFMVLRAVFALPIVFVIVRYRHGNLSLRIQNLTGLLIRSGLLMLALTCFFTSLSALTMAEAAAGLYTGPLFVAILSHFILREYVGPRRILAIIAGFAGTLLILRPDFTGGGLFNLLPIVAGAFYGAAMVATRHLCQGESAWTLTVVNQTGYLLLGLLGLVVLGVFPASGELKQSLPFFFDGWRPLAFATIGIVAAIGAMNVIGHTAIGRAYQTAEASFLAPFDYSYLAFACFWSVLVWSDELTTGNILGMALIAGAGIFIAWRRRQPDG